MPLPIVPKVARDTTIVGWLLRLPARVPTASGKIDNAAPMSTESTA
jgi:hypothetical protein